MPYSVTVSNSDAVVTESSYGPERPTVYHDLNIGPTGKYLQGYANKIKSDLLRVARMYNGKEITVYKPGDERCTKCMNTITGEKLAYNCPICGGTGYKGGWQFFCDCWLYGDVGGKYVVTTDYGNSEAEGSNRDNFIVVGAPEVLRDQYVIVMKGTTDVWKVYDAEPFMIAMQHTIVAQSVSVAGITPGSHEFFLQDWRTDQRG